MEKKMSKLYELYKNLKKENNQTIYLIESGIFYIALSDDAIYLSNKFSFKLTNLNNSVVKCGFPISSSEKYIKIFTNNNINFKIINSSNKLAYAPQNNIIKENIRNLLNDIISVDLDDLSVSEAYKFIEKLKESAQKLKDII